MSVRRRLISKRSGRVYQRDGKNMPSLYNMMPTRRAAFVSLYAIVAAVSALPARGQSPIDLGLRRELFVDRFLIDEMRGVELRLHTPTKAPRPKSPLPEKHMMTV